MTTIAPRSSFLRTTPLTTRATTATARVAAALTTSPTLRQGDIGADVADAQKLLTAKGFSPGSTDGNFGPKTRAAVVAFQRANGLTADGVIGPNTWKALRAGSTGGTGGTGGGTSLGAKMLDTARAELGNVEATNHNDGAILKYPKFFGRGSEAWCADFVSWVSKHSGGKMNNPYTPSIVNELKAQGTWKTSNPQVGDLVLFDWDHNGVANHIGLVEKVNPDGSLQTIEGNALDEASGKEGVFRHTRQMSDVLGFGKAY
jgi:Putative peptidoglycan binding domain/CHAP domain